MATITSLDSLPNTISAESDGAVVKTLTVVW